ncbi:TetM/TetW/TetO/TetS family tetracycline resistance ribosomal protection protein [Turicibacter sanguinis]|uniref:GTP-binding protein n=1 Tax=Turicibacter sanguinis TaxID=154288 RepID=UPI0018992EF4|nr:TetM/TetW/TetO/TetS family tetracycline resistance ribosomal protection protein [Turicibacter sanguinis]MDB8555987.1 TetM/TetW/TetO/TetS family tetracycline resistance ribosomal protection protein [Turicibacter sanguinis]MDB8556874.1 TetM/TetW/TetO/TetS family tetracycline resistance ribosomal protection protein [Turicibacter sanguinis]MDB8559649.1 TetM/TetW/TetO/TetS family tetracycline resistance ribosomal protection protein [Turicibacter sanguinis]
MKKTIGMFAYVDSGKTTLAEQLLYLTHSIKQCGRVDYQSSFLDHHEIEKQRGITVFAEQATFSYNGHQYYLIDTPGHIDFSAEMERSIQIMDYAILVISAVEGIQGHTETIWGLLETYQIPIFIFINKVDREGADISTILKDIEEKFKIVPLFIEGNECIKDLSIEMIETIAQTDEFLMSEYFEDNLFQDDWLKALKVKISQKKMVPVMAGSALKNIGILDFLSVLDELTDTNYSIRDEFSGRVYKVRYDDKGERVTFLKLLSGSLSVKDVVIHQKTKSQEKINQIRVYQGNKYECVSCAEAGQLVGVTGLSDFKVFDGIGALTESQSCELLPALSVTVLYDATINPIEMLSYFRRLEDEDPSLGVFWNEETKQIQIQIMGIIQLDVLKNLMKERYHKDISFGPCEVIYLETIADSITGRGHYEPLKHYAEVHVLLEPGERGSGVMFQSNCHVDQLSISYQNLIKQQVLERKIVGILTGSRVTDIKVTLLTGAAHPKHTSGGDFYEATSRAIRQGLEKANSIILEPYYDFKIEVDLSLMGKVITDIQKSAGTFESPVTRNDQCIIKGRVPVATFMDYPIEFLSYTKGLGKISLRVRGYDVCHNQASIIELKQYNKEEDRSNPSASIFCSKGSGFIVPWDLADDYMHCD